jgi:hypothetical protein
MTRKTAPNCAGVRFGSDASLLVEENRPPFLAEQAAEIIARKLGSGQKLLS